MRCKSCNVVMTDTECQAIIHTTEDGTMIYNDWCFSCNESYGCWEAQSNLDTRSYQFHDITENGSILSQDET